jgi:hypothetical protein
MSDSREDAQAALDRLETPWADAVEVKDAAPDTVAKKLVFGVNVCVKFPEAFVAAYETVEAGKLITEASVLHALWPLAIWKAYSAARSVFSALVERMSPLAYVTAAVLAQHGKSEVKQSELEAEVNEFLDAPNTREFGWHMGMTSGMVDAARGDRGAPDWFAGAIQDLETKKFLTRNGTKVKFSPKNVTWEMGL